jgi:hypothetical protein
MWERKTQLADKGQDPVWNKYFPIEVHRNVKMIDIEVYDLITGRDSQMAKIRLHFSFIQGEVNFAKKSLTCGYDGMSTLMSSPVLELTRAQRR